MSQNVAPVGVQEQLLKSHPATLCGASKQAPPAAHSQRLAQRGPSGGTAPAEVERCNPRRTLEGPREPRPISPWDAGEDVVALREARRKLGKEAFIQYIYRHHPPKSRSKVLDPSLEVKKQMQKALSHYHPDKQNRAEHGPGWILICEEVCKEITRMYNKRTSPGS